MTKSEYETKINELLTLINKNQTVNELDRLLQEYNTVLLKCRMLYETPEQHSYIINLFNEGLKNNLPLAA